MEIGLDHLATLNSSQVNRFIIHIICPLQKNPQPSKLEEASPAAKDPTVSSETLLAQAAFVVNKSEEALDNNNNNNNASTPVPTPE